MQFLDLTKGQDLWTEIILFSTFQVMVPGPDLGLDLDPGLGNLDLILGLEFLDPSPLNDHHEVLGLDLDHDRLKIAITAIDQKHISETKGVQEPNLQVKT